MTAQYETDLCRVILEEKFGKSVAIVAYILLREPSNLSGLIYNVKGELSHVLVKKSLAVLDQFNILRFKMDSNQKIIYSIDAEAITSLLKAPRCGLAIQKIFGSMGPAADVLLRVFYNGRISCSQTIREIIKNPPAVVEELTPKILKDIFQRLVETQFLIRCPLVDHNLNGCPLFSTTTTDHFVFPEKIATEFKAEDDQPETRKRKLPPDDPDAAILWRINFSRFDRFFRDEILTELVVPPNSSVDDKTFKMCTQTLKALLRANEPRSNIKIGHSIPTSVIDIARSSRENNSGLERQDIEWALRTLIEDPQYIIRKTGDSGGGLYVIDFERAIQLSCQYHIECLMREQLDTKAVRVFRMLQKNGYLEEEQIEKKSMMSPKETRELLFAMQEEGYVYTKPIGKTQDFAPSRTFYLYYVDLTKVVRGLLEHTCKSLRNITLRRKQELMDSKWLVDKKAKMDYIIDEIKSSEDKDEETKLAEVADVEETYMPPADAVKLEKFQKARTLLDQAEAETERVLLVLRLHLMMTSMNTPES